MEYFSEALLSEKTDKIPDDYDTLGEAFEKRVKISDPADTL